MNELSFTEKEAQKTLELIIKDSETIQNVRR